MPPLQPQPVQLMFQNLLVDILELPKTQWDNQYAVVFQDLLRKWPMVFPMPDQKAVRLARLLAEEIVPACGVTEALLLDRGANLLSYLMQDVCKLLGITKLSTTV